MADSSGNSGSSSGGSSGGGIAGAVSNVAGAVSGGANGANKKTKILDYIAAGLPFIRKTGAAGSAITGAAMGAGWGFSSSLAKSLVEKAPGPKYIVMFIFAILLSLMNFFYASNTTLRFSMYCVYLIAFYVFFKDNVSGNLLRNGLFFIFFGIFAADMGNFVVSKIPLPAIYQQILIFILILFGYMGPIIFLMQVNHQENLLSIILEIAIILFVLIFVIKFLAGAGIMPKVSDVNSEQKSAVIDIFGGAWATTKAIPGYIYDFYNGTRKDINNSMNQISGNSYEEEIDSSSEVSTLGLTLGDITFSSESRDYYQGDAIDAWAILEGKSLDRTIHVKSTCIVDYQKGMTEQKKSSPKVPEFTINDVGYHDVTCRYPKYSFTEEESHTLGIYADFDFSTYSYLRRYFVSDVDFMNLKKNKIDPLQYYSISSDDEEGKYTNGPIDLAIVKQNLLQPLSVSGDSFLVGIKINTNRKQGFGDGKLLKIKNLILSLPPGFELSKENGKYDCGSFDFQDYSVSDCVLDCGITNKGERCINDCSAYSNYRLVVVNSSNSSVPMITEYNRTYVNTPLQIPCYVKSKSINSVLGNQKVAIKNFRVSMDYDFQISSESSFKILEKEGFVNLAEHKDFCGYKTEFLDNTQSYSDSDIKYLVEKSKDLLNNSKDVMSLSTMCPQIMRAIIVYQNRRGPEFVEGYGYTGITEDQVKEIGMWPADFSDLDKNHQDIKLTSQYLVKKLENQCLVNGEKNLDCAIAFFICGAANGSCANVAAPAVIAIAKSPYIMS